MNGLITFYKLFYCRELFSSSCRVKKEVDDEHRPSNELNNTQVNLLWHIFVTFSWDNIKHCYCIFFNNVTYKQYLLPGAAPVMFEPTTVIVLVYNTHKNMNHHILAQYLGAARRQPTKTNICLDFLLTKSQGRITSYVIQHFLLYHVQVHCHC